MISNLLIVTDENNNALIFLKAYYRQSISLSTSQITILVQIFLSKSDSHVLIS